MKIGSLFSGIGGIDLGFKQVGIEAAFANEKDKFACKSYRNNFPDIFLIEDDIKNINAESLPDIDILTAGFPCQPFSVCGKQEGFKDDRGNLFFEIMRFIDAKKPSVVFLENVANLVEHDKGRTFNVIHNELVSRDYIIRYMVADACDYGIPQHRTRTYIVAFSDESASKSFTFPEKTGVDLRITDVINRHVRADDLYYLDFDSKEFNRLSSFITDENQLYRFTDYGIQSSNNGISFTLKANMGTWYNRIPYIKDEFGIRTISPKECLALQGFPSSYLFPDIPVKQAYKQVGNTVCVPVVRKIAHMIKSLPIK